MQSTVLYRSMLSDMKNYLRASKLFCGIKNYFVINQLTYTWNWVGKMGSERRGQRIKWAREGWLGGIVSDLLDCAHMTNQIIEMKKRVESRKKYWRGCEIHTNYNVCVHIS